MAFQGRVDEAGEFAVHGWAYNDELPDESLNVEISIAGKVAGIVPANVFRYDLRAAGFGDGRKAFWFNPFESFTSSQNPLEVRFAGSDKLLVNGSHTVHATPLAQKQTLLQLKQKGERRWRESKPEAELTWGSWMTGDSFVDQVERFFPFTPATEILEIGPGYGRILKTLLARNKQFLRFTGVDLSRACIDALRSAYRSPRMQFYTGSGDTYPYPVRFDLVLAAATFEHLFPSVAACLTHLSRSMRPGAMMFADFISHDETLSTSRAYFEEDGGAFIRFYSESELRKFFLDAGFSVVEIVHPLVLGNAAGGEEIRRGLVVARKP